MALLSKKEPSPVPVDDELERLRRENTLLKKKAGIDDYKIEEQLTQDRHAEELTILKRELEEKRQKEQEKKKTDRIKEINKIFSDNLDKKIRVFQILSDDSGRWAEFTTTLGCPSCGSNDIPASSELKTKLVESFESYQRDPVLLLERNIFNSLGYKDLQCSGCGYQWTWHYQISI